MVRFNPSRQRPMGTGRDAARLGSRDVSARQTLGEAGRVVGENKGTTFFNVLFPNREELEPRRCLIENKIDDEPSTFQAEVPAFS
jgi:hypothetical protein